MIRSARAIFEMRFTVVPPCSSPGGLRLARAPRPRVPRAHPMPPPYGRDMVQFRRLRAQMVRPVPRAAGPEASRLAKPTGIAAISAQGRTPRAIVYRRGRGRRDDEVRLEPAAGGRRFRGDHPGVRAGRIGGASTRSGSESTTTIARCTRRRSSDWPRSRAGRAGFDWGPRCSCSPLPSAGRRGGGGSGGRDLRRPSRPRSGAPGTPRKSSRPTACRSRSVEAGWMRRSLWSSDSGPRTRSRTPGDTIASPTPRSARGRCSVRARRSGSAAGSSARSGAPASWARRGWAARRRRSTKWRRARLYRQAQRRRGRQPGSGEPALMRYVFEMVGRPRPRGRRVHFARSRTPTSAGPPGRSGRPGA